MPTKSRHLIPSHQLNSGAFQRQPFKQLTFAKQCRWRTLLTLVLLVTLTVLSGLYKRGGFVDSSNAAPALGFKNKAAVGFDLTDSYGIASVRLPSGGIIHINLIAGDEAYNATMHRLSLREFRHMAPPYDYWKEGGVFRGLEDIPRELIRDARKLVGLPASPDVGALAGMLVQLRDAAQEALAEYGEVDGVIDTGVITSPDLFALYDEDLYDAAMYAVFKRYSSKDYFEPYLLTNQHFRRQPKHRDAAFLGFDLEGAQAFGAGVEHIHDYRVFHNVLSVYYSRTALSLELSVRKLGGGTDLLEYQQHDSFFDASLGLESRPSYADRDLELYWSRVRFLITECVLTQSFYDANVTDLLLIGPSANDADLRRNAIHALRELENQRDDPQVWKSSAPEYVASEGAAKMARLILDSLEE